MGTIRQIGPQNKKKKFVAESQAYHPMFVRSQHAHINI